MAFVKHSVEEPEKSLRDYATPRCEDIKVQECRISFAYLKTILENKYLKVFVPCSRSLLKPVERLMELVHMVGEVWIFEAHWLLNIYFFMERSIQESTLDIHLMKLEVMMSSIGQKDTN
jgi:hypothetical protein